MARQSTTARITSAMFALIVSSLNRGEGVIIRDKGTELGVIGHHAGSLTVIDGSGKEFIIPPWNVKNCTIRKLTILSLGLDTAMDVYLHTSEIVENAKRRFFDMLPGIDDHTEARRKYRIMVDMNKMAFQGMMTGVDNIKKSA